MHEPNPNARIRWESQRLYCYKGDVVPAMRTVCVDGEVRHDKEGEYQLSLYLRRGDVYKHDASLLPQAYDNIRQSWEEVTKFPLPGMPLIAMPSRYEVSGKLLDDQIRIVVITPDQESAEALGEQMLAKMSENLGVTSHEVVHTF